MKNENILHDVFECIDRLPCDITCLLNQLFSEAFLEEERLEAWWKNAFFLENIYNEEKS